MHSPFVKWAKTRYFIVNWLRPLPVSTPTLVLLPFVRWPCVCERRQMRVHEGYIYLGFSWTHRCGFQFLLCLLTVLLSHPGIEMASRTLPGATMERGRAKGGIAICCVQGRLAPEGHGCEGERFEISEVRSWLVETLPIIRHANVSQRLGSH